MPRPRKIENVQKKINARARNVLWHGIGNFVWGSGSGRGKICDSREKFSRGERKIQRGSRKTNETPQGTWLGRAWAGSLWLCYAGPLARKQESEISGSW